MGLLFSLISAAHTMAFWQITNLKRSLSQIFIKYSFVFFLKAVAGNAVFWSFIALPSIAKVIKFLYLYVTHKVDKEIAKDFATAMIIEFMVQFLVIMSTPWQSFWAGYILSCVTISMIIHGFKEDTLREDDISALIRQLIIDTINFTFNLFIKPTLYKYLKIVQKILFKMPAFKIVGLCVIVVGFLCVLLDELLPIVIRIYKKGFRRKKIFQAVHQV